MRSPDPLRSPWTPEVPQWFPLPQAMAGSMRRWPDALVIDVDDMGQMANTAQAAHSHPPQ